MGFSTQLQLSWKFMVDCVKFLKNNPDLVILPLLSLIVLGAMVVSMIYLSFHEFNRVYAFYQSHNILLLVGSLMLFYFLLSFIMIYFNASLITCILQRLQANNISVVQGMRLTLNKSWLLLQWALISSTICLLINSLERVHSVVADIMSAIFGFSWAVTSYFVMPIMVAENVGPITAFERSIRLIGKGWRKLLSVNLVFFVIILVIVGVAHLIAYFFPQVIADLPISLSALAFILVAWVILSITFNTIFNCALYLTIKNQPLAGLNGQMLNQLMQRTSISN